MACVRLRYANRTYAGFAENTYTSAVSVADIYLVFPIVPIMQNCPNCGEKSVSELSLLRTAIGIGFNPKCNNCGASYSVGPIWQACFAGIALLAFAVSAALSIKAKSYFPYLIFVAITFMGILVISSLAAPKVITVTTKRKLVDWVITLVVLIGLFFYLQIAVH